MMKSIYIMWLVHVVSIN
jgi:hypothetical protein